MREIKFRAWEKNLKEIIPVDDINFNTKMINIFTAWRMFDEVELMQYTGRKDMNGKDIYEGDILYRDGRWALRVEFENGSMVLKDAENIRYTNNCTRICLSEFPLSSWTVIGNIYQNKELLEMSVIELKVDKTTILYKV